MIETQTPSISQKQTDMKVRKGYYVEIAKYDFRNDDEIDSLESKERSDNQDNGVDSYEDFRIRGIYDTYEEAKKRFNALRDKQIKEWEEDGTFATNAAPYDAHQGIVVPGGDDPTHIVTMSRNPKCETNGELNREEWVIYADTPNEYHIYRYDNDIEFRIRIRCEF